MNPCATFADCIPSDLLARWPGLVRESPVPLSGGRCNLVWRLGDLVIKVYRPAAARPLFANDPEAEFAVLRKLSGTGLAPEPLLAGDGWLVYRHVAGEIWGGDPQPVARALWAVHQADPPAGVPRRPSGSAALMRQAASMALPHLPPLPKTSEVPPSKACLVHGDAVPGNIIVSETGLTFIDWQSPGLGDPAEDLAFFLSPAMQFLYRGAPLSAEQSAAFLAAYKDGEVVSRYHQLRRLLHWRIASHCALRAAEGAPDYQAALQLELALI